MAQTKTTQSPLLTAPIPTMMRKLAIPVAIGAFFNTMFNVVDTIYGGAISDDTLAALSLSFPIIFVTIAFGFGFSLGGTTLIGNTLGGGKQRDAQRYATQSIGLALFASVLIAALMINTAPALLRVMGATDPAYRQLALDYIIPFYYGTPFFLATAALIAILNAVGNTIPGRNFLVGGFLLNLVLNPWFIFGGLGVPAMGVQGIALATVVVQVLGMFYGGYEVAKTGLITRETIREDWVPRFDVYGQLMNQGLPATIDILGVSVGFFILNAYVSPFGQNAVAALGAGSRIEQVALLPVLGVNTAILALTAQNNGAGNIDRIYEIFRVGLKYGILLMTVTMLLAITFARPLMSMFTTNPEILAIGVVYIRIRVIGLTANAVFFCAGNILRGLKRPYWPLFWNIVRFILLPWFFIVIFVTWLEYGLIAIWVVSTLSFFLGAAATFITAYRLLPPRPNTA